MRLKISLPVPNLQPLIDYRDQLAATLEEIEETPKCSLQVIKRGADYKYYFRRDETQNPIYITRKNASELVEAGQQEYNYRMKKLLSKEITRIDRFLENNNLHSVEDLYSKCDEGRKRLIRPFAISDDEYANAWQLKHTNTRTVTDDVYHFVTARGDVVRSKSEVIIADTLFSMGIPYCYEAEVPNLKGRKRLVDFLILDVKNRKEIYYEHFGMADDPEYMNSNVEKINQYASAGITFSDNFIATFETIEHPVDRQTIKQIFAPYARL